jgi:replicative DNA helicase
MRKEICQLKNQITEASTKKDSVPIESDEDEKIVFKINKKKVRNDFQKAGENIANAIENLQCGVKNVVDESAAKIVEVAPMVVEAVENIVQHISPPRDIVNKFKSLF